MGAIDMILLSSIREWVTFAADMCILLITTYIFYLTFISKKIKFMSVSQSLSTSNGNNFSVVLENKTLSPVVILDIYLIIDNKYKIQVKKFENPLILDVYTAQKVISDRYSHTVPTLPSFIGKNTTIEVQTSRKKLYLRLHKCTPRVTREMKNLPNNVTKITNTYNEKIVPENAKFVLIVSKGDWQNTLFIFGTGVMTGEVLGYNGLPEEAVEDKETLLCFLNSWLKPTGMEYYVEELKTH